MTSEVMAPLPSAERSELAEEADDLADATLVRQDAGVHAGDGRRAARAHERPGEPVAAVVDVDLTGPLEPVAGVVLVERVADRREAVVARAFDRRVGERALRRPRLLDEGPATAGVRLVEGGEVAVDGGGCGVGHGDLLHAIADTTSVVRRAATGR